jgi:hypothetical protein
MSPSDNVQGILVLSDKLRGRSGAGIALSVLGLLGLIVGFFAGPATVGWTALYVATAMFLGLAMFGAVLSAIFELTGSKWGRAYRRFAEGSVALMPVGLVGLLVVLAGAGHFVPWLHGGHELEGHKAMWLARGFWSLRLLLAVLGAYALGLFYVYTSIRRDFCVEGVRERFTGKLAVFFGRGITDAQAERERLSRRLVVLAPVVAVVYAVTFSLVGFDFVMALEPHWFSTLFGVWYFWSHMFTGLALLAVAAMVLRRRLGLEPWLTSTRQRDIATLLLAFTLLNVDFFWSQYLTIWYGNLPEETEYLIPRVLDEHLPWHHFAYPALLCFFFIPLIALLFRKVKQTLALLLPIALVPVLGIFLVRFLEIAPPLLGIQPGYAPAEIVQPVLSSLLVWLGFAGIAWQLYRRLLSTVPILPVGDDIFARSNRERHA